MGTQNILENVTQQGDSRANLTDILEFALMIMLMVSIDFHQRKKIINWFVKPFSFDGNVEATININTPNITKLCFHCFFLFLFCENFCFTVCAPWLRIISLNSFEVFLNYSK